VVTAGANERDGLGELGTRSDCASKPERKVPLAPVGSVPSPPRIVTS
jgi:hypothetical protein